MQLIGRITAKKTTPFKACVNPGRSLQLLSRAYGQQNKEAPKGQQFSGGFSSKLMGKVLLSLFKFSNGSIVPPTPPLHPSQPPPPPPPPHPLSMAVVSKHVFIYSLCVSAPREFPPLKKAVSNIPLLSLRQLSFTVFLTSHPGLWQQ